MQEIIQTTDAIEIIVEKLPFRFNLVDILIAVSILIIIFVLWRKKICKKQNIAQ